MAAAGIASRKRGALDAIVAGIGEAVPGALLRHALHLIVLDQSAGGALGNVGAGWRRRGVAAAGGSRDQCPRGSHDRSVCHRSGLTLEAALMLAAADRRASRRRARRHYMQLIY